MLSTGLQHFCQEQLSRVPTLIKTWGFLKSHEILVHITRHVHKLHVDKLYEKTKQGQSMFSRKLQTFLKFQTGLYMPLCGGVSMKLSRRFLACRLRPWHYLPHRSTDIRSAWAAPVWFDHAWGSTGEEGRWLCVTAVMRTLWHKLIDWLIDLWYWESHYNLAKAWQDSVTELSLTQCVSRWVSLYLPPDLRQEVMISLYYEQGQDDLYEPSRTMWHFNLISLLF